MDLSIINKLPSLLYYITIKYFIKIAFLVELTIFVMYNILVYMYSELYIKNIKF